MDTGIIKRKLLGDNGSNQALLDSSGLTILGGRKQLNYLRMSGEMRERPESICAKRDTSFSKEYSQHLSEFGNDLLRHFTKYLYFDFNLPALLCETSSTLKKITKSAVGLAFILKAKEANLVFCGREGAARRISLHSRTIEAFVAMSKEFVMTTDVYQDSRFTEGSGRTPKVDGKATICVPVVAPDGKCFAVLELFRKDFDEPYGDAELQITVAMTNWIAAGVHQYKHKVKLQDNIHITDSILNMTNDYFSRVTNFEELLSRILEFTKSDLGAESGSFFIVDKHNPVLCGDLYEEAISNEDNISTLLKKRTKVELDNDRDIVAFVTKRGIAVNVNFASGDTNFIVENSKPDVKPTSVLCAPIQERCQTIGAFKLVNKKNGAKFTEGDEAVLKIICSYCALSIHYLSVIKSTEFHENGNGVTGELLGQQILPCKHQQYDFINNLPLQEIPDNFLSFSWHLIGYEDQLVGLAIFMFQDLIDNSHIHEKKFITFLLTVRGCYRNNPYHNWHHAFSVCHCMYNIIKRNMDVFSDMEIAALLISALCHDVDHRGFTNNFLFLTNDPLSQLYKVSPLENHHFQTTLFMLQACDIFDQLVCSFNKDIVQNIKDAILATDLVFYFQWRSKLMDVLDDNTFSSTVPYHRFLMKCIIMTSCDLCGQCKPFSVAKTIVNDLYREFYMQGDCEKQLGFCPLSIMDREKQHLIAQDQVQFLSVVCLPCVSLLSRMLPNTQDLYHQCYLLRDKWREELTPENLGNFGPDYYTSQQLISNMQ